MLIAITREVSPSLARCELTHLPRQAIDLDLARAQHRQYEEALAGLGCTIHHLPAEVGKTLYAGLTRRTNPAGVEQLQALLAPYGYAVRGVPVEGCLHLKSAVTQVAPGALLINRHWVGAAVFEPLQLLDVDPSEPYAANALRVGEAVIYPSAYPRTRRRLEAHGIAVRPVDVSELAKAEGAVTCCSLIFTV